MRGTRRPRGALATLDGPRSSSARCSTSRTCSRNPTPELRWPLSPTSHPELRPHFDIAAELAEPGLDWLELCRRGAQYRRLDPSKRELVAYLRGWCEVARHEVDAAVTHLAPLIRAGGRGLASAARHDLAHILVDHGDADEAERVLTRARVRDLEVLDLLAAAYADVGKRGASLAITQLALGRDDGSAAAARCHRLARRILLTPDPGRPLMFGLAQMAATNDRTCARLDRLLQCWREPGVACTAHFTALGLDERTGKLFAAYRGWPGVGPEATFHRWWEIATHAIDALPLPGADILAAQALIAAQGFAECGSTQSDRIAYAASSVRAAPDLSPVAKELLTVLLHTPDQYCR